MKKSFLSTILSFMIALPVFSANRVVELGENIQTQVTASSAGDVVIIRAGEYQNQNISINEPIRLVREKGTNVTIGGSLTYTDVNGTVVLRDFTLLAAGKGSLRLTNCSNFGMQNLTKLPEGIVITGSKVVIRDCAFTGNLTINGASDVEMVDSSCINLSVNSSSFHAVGSSFGTVTVSNDSNLTLENSTFSTGSFTGGKATLRKITASGNVTFTQCDWQDHGSTYNQNLTSNQSHSRLSLSTVKKAFTHGHAAYGGQNLDCVIYQSTIGRQTGALLHSKAYRTWVTYSTIHHAQQTGGSVAHFVGNNIYLDIAKGNDGIVINGANCVASIFNNHFYGAKDTTSYSIIADNAEKKRGHSTYANVKTITLTYPRNVKNVTNQIRMEAHNYNYPGRCKMKFFYTDGTNQFSNENTRWENNYATKTYNNPAPGKPVSKVEVWIRSEINNSSYELYSRNNNVNSYGEYAIYAQSAKRVDIQNNLIRDWDTYSNCIFAQAAPTDGLFVKGNAFWRSSGWHTIAVYSPKGADRMIGNSPVPAPDICAYNYFQDNSKGVTGGIVNNNNFTGADPGFVNNASDWTLKNDSILKDKGPTEAEFNDHDNSRNDVGFRGGHRYDANGWNATKPVVLSADQSHFRLTKGDGVPLIIKARAAVSTP